MATVKEINHDTSLIITDFYDTVVDTDGGLSVTAAAELGGSTNGVSIDLDAGTQTMRLDESVTFSADEFRWRIRLDLGGVTNSNAGSELLSVNLLTAIFNDRFRFVIDANGGDSGFTIDFVYRSDVTGLTILTTEVMPSSGDTCLEIRAVRESADGNNDGEVEAYINGVSQASLSNVQNFNVFDIGQTRISMRSLNANFTGTYKYDEWILDDIASTSLCAATLGLAAMTKPADVDAAGTFIYLALLAGGTPILTKISTNLDADGATVFDPGAGDNIGVECGRFSSDTVWVAGNFDGTNVVEKSEDAGASFVVKDDATIGDVRSFIMGPDSDERVLVFDETNGDILETRDDGASWDSINVSVTPEVNAIARLGRNVEESIFGNDGGANNSVNYSVNSGDDLEDFQTGVYPNANATKVIVN